MYNVFLILQKILTTVEAGDLSSLQQDVEEELQRLEDFKRKVHFEINFMP